MKILYTIHGKVKKGQGRGKPLGFPTANINLHKKIPEGIYAGEVSVRGKSYKAAVFIGSAKTFNEKDYKAESFIFDFDENIYGKWITVKIYEKIRDNEKFLSAEALVRQIKKDILTINKFFKLNFLKNV